MRSISAGESSGAAWSPRQSSSLAAAHIEHDAIAVEIPVEHADAAGLRGQSPLLVALAQSVFGGPPPTRQCMADEQAAAASQQQRERDRCPLQDRLRRARRLAEPGRETLLEQREPRVGGFHAVDQLAPLRRRQRSGDGLAHAARQLDELPDELVAFGPCLDRLGHEAHVAEVAVDSRIIPAISSGSLPPWMKPSRTRCRSGSGWSSSSLAKRSPSGIASASLKRA